METGNRDDARLALLVDALDALGDARSRLRVEVLARVAAVLHFAGQPEEAITVSAEALALAEDLGDGGAVLAALHGRQAALMGVDHLAERRETLDRELALAERRGELEHVALTCQARVYTHLEEGALDAARAELDRYAAVSALMHRPPVEHSVLAWRAVMAQLDGALDEAEQLAWQGHALAHRVYIADADALLASQLCFIRRDQVRLAELVPILEASATSDPVDLSWRAGATIALAGAGDRARARAAFDVSARDGFADVPRDFWWLARMSLFAEGAALVGDPAHADRLYAALEPYADRHAQLVFTAHLGSVHRVLGLLAARLGRQDRALEHLEVAWARHVGMGAAAPALRSACELAGALHQTGRRGDGRRAEQLLADATAQAAGTALEPLVARLGTEARAPRADPAGVSLQP